MIAEALKLLADQARTAAKPERILPDDPRTARFVLDGAIEEVDLSASPRKHKAGSLADVIALANRFAASADTEGDGYSPVVWYDAERVVLVVDDDGHRAETATLDMEVSDVFAKLVELRRSGSGAWMDPKAFVRLLKVDLARTLDPGVLLNKVRSLKFNNGTETRVEVKRNFESLGRDVVNKVTTEDEIPEDVTLDAPVYKTPGETDPLPVRCSVDTDPAACALRLLPLPDEIERVRQMAVASIGQRLKEGLNETVMAYQGKP